MQAIWRANGWVRRAVALTIGLAALAACTQTRPVSVAGLLPSPATSATPTGDPSLAAFPSPSPTATAAASASPTDGTFSFPPVLPRGTVPPFPVASFTPAVITPLGGTDPGASGAASPGASADPGTSGAATPSPLASGASPTPSPSPSGVASPAASSTPFPNKLATIAVTHAGGLAVDASNNLWLGDQDAKAVKMYTLDGAIQGTFPVGGPPAALAFDANGKLWVQLADLVTLVRMDVGGANPTTFHLGVAGPADATAIPGLAAIAGGGMWVLNGGGSNTVANVDGTGKIVNTVEAPGRVVAMTADAGGNVWLAINDTNRELAKFSPAGTALGTFTDLGGLDDPRALAIDNQGTVWLAGRFTPVGQPTQGVLAGFAGTGVRQAFLTTGADRAPGAIAFDSQGNLVLANVVVNGLTTHVGFQKVTTAGQVLAEQGYNAPTAVITDRNGVFWGVNPTLEVFRFRL